MLGKSFVFGEIIEDANFVNRTDELNQLVRDLADGSGASQLEEETHS